MSQQLRSAFPEVFGPQLPSKDGLGLLPQPGWQSTTSGKVCQVLTLICSSDHPWSMQSMLGLRSLPGSRHEATFTTQHAKHAGVLLCVPCSIVTWWAPCIH